MYGQWSPCHRGWYVRTAARRRVGPVAHDIDCHKSSDRALHAAIEQSLSTPVNAPE